MVNINGGIANGGTPTITSFGVNNPHNNLINGKPFFTQSAPQLPHLQTKFGKTSNDTSSTTLMTAPTSIEIEIPEELPVSAIPTPVPVEHGHLQTKPRSSTVSISPLAYQQQQQQQQAQQSGSKQASSQSQTHGLSRRLTVGGINSNRPNDDEGQEKHKIGSKTIAEEISRSSSFIKGPNGPSNVSSRNIASDISKIHRRTPSPSKVIPSGSGISPVKKSGLSPITMNANSNVTASIMTDDSISGNANITSNVEQMPTMKPMASINDNKDILLHPLNVPNATHGHGNFDVPPISLPVQTIVNPKEKEGSRVNTEFKRNNPNLKLQMPLPTPMTRNKLIDTNGNVINGDVSTNNSGNNPVLNENINQFGFNTSVTQNVPVSMTPISEKHMDFSHKIKRSHSVSNRKNSLSNDALNPSQHPPPSHSVLNALVSSNGGSNMHLSNTSSNSSVPLYSAQTAASNLINSGDNNNNTASQISTNAAPITMTTTATSNDGSGHSTAMSIVSGNNINSNNTNNDGITTDDNPIQTASGSNTNTSSKPNFVMAPPPRMLRMSLFQDVEQSGSFRRVDRKPEVLKELDMLLHLFEESLPAMENALKQQLIPIQGTTLPEIGASSSTEPETNKSDNTNATVPIANNSAADAIHSSSSVVMGTESSMRA